MPNLLLQKRYDTIAPRWDSPAYEGLRRDDLLQKILGILKLDKLQGSPEILNAMCGTGTVGLTIKKYLQEKGIDSRVSFLDFSQGMLDQIPDDEAEIKVCDDITMMPFAHSFDRIVLRNGLYDLEQTSQLPALRQIYRVLKDDGLFVLVTYCPTKELQAYYNEIVNYKDWLAGWNDGEHDRYFLTEQEAREELDLAGFKNIRRMLKYFSVLHYEGTREMDKLAAAKWKRFVLDIPKTIRKKIGIELQSDGTVTYQFPGIVLVATK